MRCHCRVHLLDNLAPHYGGYARELYFWICMGDSAHTTHHSTPGTTHCHQKCVSKYSRNTKKLDVTLWGALHCINLRRENRTQKFPSVLVRIFGDNGSPKTTPYYKQTDSTKFSITCTKFRTGTCAKNSGAAQHRALALFAPLVGHRHSKEKTKVANNGGHVESEPMAFYMNGLRFQHGPSPPHRACQSSLYPHSVLG
jgi:hypothetical protein